MDTSTLVETGQRTAVPVMALRTERCNGEARAAVAAEGSAGAARQTAFEMLGRIASQEVKPDPKVMTTINAFATHLSQADLMTALGPQDRAG